MAEFVPKRRYSGGTPGLSDIYLVKSGESVTKGMMCKITSGVVEPADSGDATMYGVSDRDASAGEEVQLYELDTIYAVLDASARNTAATLDLDSNSTGVTTSSNVDFFVFQQSSDTEDTWVFLHPNASIFSL